MSPAAWDRLADATRQLAAAGQLSIVTLGDVHAEDLAKLTPHFSRLEQLVLDVPPRDPISQHRAELNRAVDAATSDWILIVREREVVDDDLAVEIARTIATTAARGFRIRSLPVYRGRPLHAGTGDAEVRLFHRRYYLRFAEKGEWREIAVQGTVVRLSAPLRSMSFATSDAHREQLMRTGTQVRALRRLIRFFGYCLAARTVDGNTLRYLWIESAFDSAQQ